MSKQVGKLLQEAEELRRTRLAVTRGVGRLLGRTGSSQPLSRSAQDMNDSEVRQDLNRGYREGQRQRVRRERST